MHVHYVALLAAVLIASADATLADSVSGLSDLSRSIGFDQGGVSTRRLLRVHKTAAGPAEDKTEERAKLVFLKELVEMVQVKRKLNVLLQKGTSVNSAFRLLKVDKEAENIFKTKEWKTWATYVAMRYKEKQDSFLIAEMTGRFTVKGYSKMLANAAKDPVTKDTATRLEAAQIKHWLDLRSSPDKIFIELQLYKAADIFFDSPPFVMWSKYCQAYNTKFTAKWTSELDVLTNHYSEYSLLKMLTSADNIDSDAATKLRGDLVRDWLDLKAAPDDLFKFLKLDEAGAALFSSPLLATWVQYMKLFNDKIPSKKTSMIQQFSESYGDEKLAMMIQAALKADDTDRFAKNLQKAHFKQWMVDGKSPDDIYKTVLKLESTNSPNADIWRTYYKAYDEQFPGKLFSFNP